MTQTANAMQIDTRLIQPNSRLSLVFRTFDQLGVDATMELLSDNDPEVWRVAVTKLKGKHGVTSCCGACGG